MSADEARTLQELRRIFEAARGKRRRALRHVIDVAGGERRYRQLINRLYRVGDETLAGLLELLLLEYKMRSRPLARPQTRARTKQDAETDIRLLLEAEDRARREPPGKSATQLIRETVIGAIETGIPAKPAGASPDAIVRRLFGVLRPRKRADSMLPFEFPALQSRITPYRRSVKRPD